MARRVPESSLLEARDLSVRFPQAVRDAIREVSLAIAPGERLAVLGASGSGKSTLALALVGAIPHLIPAEVRGGVSWSGAAPPPTLAAGTGLAACVQQDVDAQLVALTVEDEIAFALENRGLPPDEIEHRIATALAGPVAQGLRRIDATLSLSAGWRQRLSLAAALAEQSRLLVIDEPTAHLDEGAAAAAIAAAGEAAGAGAAVLLVEHRADLVAPFADRLLVLDRSGAIAAFGAPRDVLAALAVRGDLGVRLPPATVAAAALRASGLLGEGLAPLTAADLRASLGARAADPDVRDCVTRAVAPPRPAGGGVATALLTLDRVSLRRGGKPVLQDVSLAVHAAEIVGLAGRNGAGKTSLALLGAGALRPATGRAVNHAASPVMVPQNPSLVFASATLALEAARRGLDWPAAADSLQRFGIMSGPDWHPLRHSHGELRRIALALAVARDRQRLVVLDEPTAGLDAAGLAVLEQTLTSLAANGAGVLLVSHDVDFLSRVCDRIVVLDGGRVAAIDRADLVCHRAAAGSLPVAPPPSAALALAFGWTPDRA
jgi:energy-coupling factor transporter ATP-binding protein EcfA2